MSLSKLIHTITMLNDERIDRLSVIAEASLIVQFHDSKERGICPVLAVVNRNPYLTPRKNN